jgi:carbon storage regulator CsrA
MLVLRRTKNQSIDIGDGVTVRVLGVNKNEVELEITAPAGVLVRPTETAEKKTGSELPTGKVTAESTGPERLTAKEAAALLGCHVAAIYRWAFQGKIIAWRVGSKWQFDRQSVENFRQPAVTMAEVRQNIPTRQTISANARIAQEKLRARGLA